VKFAVGFLFKKNKKFLIFFLILILTEEDIFANILSSDGSDSSSMIWANSMYNTKSEKRFREKCDQSFHETHL